jgi:hypothetical protein
VGTGGTFLIVQFNAHFCAGTGSRDVHLAQELEHAYEYQVQCDAFLK